MIICTETGNYLPLCEPSRELPELHGIKHRLDVVNDAGEVFQDRSLKKNQVSSVKRLLFFCSTGLLFFFIFLPQTRSENTAGPVAAEPALPVTPAGDDTLHLTWFHLRRRPVRPHGGVALGLSNLL